MNQGSSYQIVSEDALSSGVEDDDSSSDHQGPYEDHFRQETETPTCNSHTHSTIGEIQRGWTYEDQFKELYTLSSEPGRKEFLDSLFAYMQQNGTPITRVPIMAKQPLDLYKLYQHVVAKGGLLEVINRKGWREIAKDLELPSSITSAAFTLRTQYVKYLYAYECESEGFSKPSDLQTAIENNKRERRPSDLEKIPGHLIIHSPEMAIMRTAEIGATVRSPLVTSAPIQVVASPTTISLPCGTVPSYPGGIILAAPGKPPMALTQQMGSPQLVHVAGSNSPLPLMVPTAMAAPQQPAATKVTSPSIVNHTIPVAPTVTHVPVASTIHPLPSPVHPIATNHNGTGDNDTQPPSPKKAALDKDMESFSLPSMHINLTPGPYSLWRGSNSSVSVEITVNGVLYEGILKATGTVRTSQTSGKRVA